MKGHLPSLFAMAAVIVTPLELTLVDDAVADDDNDDGNSAGAEHCGIFPRATSCGIIPRATSIDCTIARLAGASLDLYQAVLLYIPCLAIVEPEHSNATGTGLL
jgi:hypothetical protein